MDILGALIGGNGGGVTINEAVDYNVLKPSSPSQRKAQLEARSSVNELLSTQSAEDAKAYDSVSTLAISKDLNDKQLIAAETASNYLQEAQNDFVKASQLDSSNRNPLWTLVSAFAGTDVEKERLVKAGNEKLDLAARQEAIMGANSMVASATANKENAINTAGRMFAKEAVENELNRNKIFPSDPDLAKTALVTAAQKARTKGEQGVVDLTVEMKRTLNKMRINEGQQASNPQAQRFLRYAESAMRNGDPVDFKYAKAEYDAMVKRFDETNKIDETTRAVEDLRIDNDGMIPVGGRGAAVAQMFENSPSASNIGNIPDPNEKAAYEEYNQSFLANALSETAKTNSSIADKMREELKRNMQPAEWENMRSSMKSMDKQAQNELLASAYAARYITEGDKDLVSLIGNKAAAQLVNSGEVVAATNAKSRDRIIQSFNKQYTDWFAREYVLNNPEYAEYIQAAKDPSNITANFPQDVKVKLASELRSQSTINQWFGYKKEAMGSYQNRTASILSMADWENIPYDMYKQLNGVR